MPILGFDALGRFALGQIGQAGQGNLTQAAGVGVAGSLAANPAALLIGARGTGTAGSLAISESVGFTGAVGVGVAGAITTTIPDSLVGVAGVGVAGSLSGPNVVPSVPFFGGYDGIVSARYALGQITGRGIDGGISISVVVPQAVGIGVAGKITAFISGGGGNKPLPEVEEPKHRDKRIKTGLLPLEKRPVAPKPARKKPQLPPTFDAPPLVPAGTPPTPTISPAVVDAVEDIRRQIMDAQDASDIEAFLKGLEHDDQDAADIADVLALLD